MACRAATSTVTTVCACHLERSEESHPVRCICSSDAHARPWLRIRLATAASEAWEEQDRGGALRGEMRACEDSMSLD